MALSLMPVTVGRIMRPNKMEAERRLLPLPPKNERTMGTMNTMPKKP